MPDITSISAVIGSVKSALDIVKYLNETGTSLEKADLKLKLAELASALAEAKLEMISIQEVLLEKDQRIAELNEAFELRDALRRVGDAYYKMGDDGNPKGVAHCVRCFESDHRARQLVDTGGPMRLRVCTACGHKYDKGRSWDSGD